MRIKRFIKTYRFLKKIKKYKGERGVWRLVYRDRYLKFSADTYKAPNIIRGFIRSVEKEIN